MLGVGSWEQSIRTDRFARVASAGSDAFGSFRPPDPKWFVVALCVAAVVLIVARLIPASRRTFVDRLLPIITKAFGGVGAAHLVGSTVASAAPTPGGLGAVEAALIAGLVSAGLDSTIAVRAVFMYRLFTFWAPILPGWISFQWLQRNEYI